MIKSPVVGSISNVLFHPNDGTRKLDIDSIYMRPDGIFVKNSFIPDSNVSKIVIVSSKIYSDIANAGVIMLYGSLGENIVVGEGFDFRCIPDASIVTIYHSTKGTFVRFRVTRNKFDTSVRSADFKNSPAILVCDFIEGLYVNIKPGQKIEIHPSL